MRPPSLHAASRAIPAGRLPGRVSAAVIPALVLSGALAAAAFAQDPAGDPFTRYRSLPADSTEARRAVIESEPDWFLDIVDSLMVFEDLDDPARRGMLERAAEDYLAVTGDSLLLSDLAFVSDAAPEVRRDWYRAVVTDVEGWIVRGNGDVAASVPLFREAAEAYRRLGHLRREAVAWGSLGVSHFRLNDYEAAEEAYRTALEARRRLGDRWMEARSLRALGSTYLQTGEYRKSLDFYEQARDVIRTLDRPVDLGTTWGYIGNTLYRMGRLDEAVTAYEKAIEIYGEPGKTFMHPSRTGLANVYADLGEPARALPLYREQLTLAEEAEDLREQTIVLRNIATALNSLGDTEGALRELARAREICEATGDRIESSNVANEIGSCYEDLGNTGRALESFREAERLAAEAEDPLARANALNNLGNVYQTLELTDRALESFREAKSIYTDLEAPHMVRKAIANMAIVHEGLGDLETALSLHREALALNEELGDRSGVALSRINIANVLAGQGKLLESLETSRSAVELAEALDQTYLLWPAYLGLADCFERGGELDSARVYNDLAIEAMERSRGRALSEETRAAFLGKRAFVYEAQVHVLGKLHREDRSAGLAEAAFVAAERGKARALLDAMAEGRVDLDAGVDPSLIAERDGLERTIAAIQFRLRQAESGEAPAGEVRALKAELRDLEAGLTRVLEEIRLNNPRVAAMDSGEPESPEAVRKALLGGKGRILLEYALGDSASYLWVMTGTSLDLHSLPPRSGIESEVARLRKGLTSPDASGDSNLVSAAAALHALLLEPAAKEIAGARTVYVVPDGALHGIPFDVLLPEVPPPPGPAATAGARNAYFAGLPYAFRNVDLRYGPSATTLVVLEGNRRRDAGDRSLLAIGDPVFEPAGPAPAAADTGSGLRGGLDPLPFTRDEVETIGEQFGSSRCTLLLGDEAREGRLVQPGFLAGFDILHFATHGLIDERRPERSRLALSYPRDPSEDGYLQASEIYRLDLGADLVVLSACETGLGRVVRGEGVLGLPRAFFYAGATSVVVSLWSVSDRSTAELMAGFYRELVAEKASAARALSRAKAGLREGGRFAHPFYWSPFVVMGAS